MANIEWRIANEGCRRPSTSPPLKAGFGRATSLAMALAALSFAAGCMSLGGWINDYHEAERRQREQQRDLLIFYKDYLSVSSGEVHEVLNSGPIKALTQDMVRCILVTDYEPDRAYVAQFGIQRAPAVVVLRTDGTYHARVGPVTQQEVEELLRDARSPGQAPTANAYVPRPVEYRWRHTLESALAEAKRLDRPVLIYFKWWVKGESAAMQRELERPEVFRILADHVHCRLDYDYLPNRRHMAVYGVQRAPALAIIHRDGTYHSIEGFLASDDIVRFVTRARPPGAAPAATPEK